MNKAPTKAKPRALDPMRSAVWMGLSRCSNCASVSHLEQVARALDMAGSALNYIHARKHKGWVKHYAAEIQEARMIVAALQRGYEAGPQPESKKLAALAPDAAQEGQA